MKLYEVNISMYDRVYVIAGDEGEAEDVATEIASDNVTADAYPARLSNVRGVSLVPKGETFDEDDPGLTVGEIAKILDRRAKTEKAEAEFRAKQKILLPDMDPKPISEGQ